ncbi:hypothetical protein SAMN05216325_12940 [Nitrosomonas marina]|uniref:Uncharacterized protein n=1 Tax=Nitrosomonas marina TaxID=917 RepID=A0A1H8I7W8_9PROT|nr:hypothetical protein SAMN05216325_12940 [Nitrosomonas marina]
MVTLSINPISSLTDFVKLNSELLKVLGEGETAETGL